MKLNLFVVAVFSTVALLCAGEVRGQTEGRPCTAEPTDQLIAYGDVVTCQITPVGDSDLFRFQGALDDILTVRVTDPSGGSSFPSCNLELFRPDLTLVTSVTNVTMCEIRTTLDRSGLFTVRVTEVGNDELMNYSVELDRLSPPSPTATAITFGDTLVGKKIDPRGDADLFLFNGVLGEVVTVRVTDPSGGSSFPSCSLELFRPDLTLVTSVTNVTMCEIRTTLDRSGLFTMRVTEVGNDEFMTYMVELDRLFPSSPTATSINPGNTFANRQIDPQGDADLFVFNGVSGDVISLRVTDPSGGSSFPSPVMQLFRPNGTLLATIVDVTTARIDATLDETGVFTVRVSENGNDELMTYNIEYQCLLGSCPSFHKLTVGRIGAGNVTASPIGIDCGSDCSERYFAGTVVTLTAVPDPFWVFNGWSGDSDCADGIVTTTAEKTCTATFVQVVVDFYDRDGKTDLAVWRPSTGFWYVIRSSDGSIRSRQWGAGYAPYNDVPVPGDYDGDDTIDLAVWRASTGVWHIIRSSDGGLLTHQWGHAPYNDVPVPGDYDGDGKTDIAIWRASTGFWYVIKSSDGSVLSRQWGAGFDPYNDVPVPGDYDGDGKTDIAIWRASTGFWYVIKSSDGSFLNAQWGAGYDPYKDVPVPGDYDGDGKTDIAVWRASTGFWYVIKSSDGSFLNAQWGAGYDPYKDVPVPGDYDGDGKTDIAIWRASTGFWYVIRSSDGAILSRQWGAGVEPYNDVPVPR